jgi:hypothetical protein
VNSGSLELGQRAAGRSVERDFLRLLLEDVLLIHHLAATGVIRGRLVGYIRSQGPCRLGPKPIICNILQWATASEQLTSIQVQVGTCLLKDQTKLRKQKGLINFTEER